MSETRLRDPERVSIGEKEYFEVLGWYAGSWRPSVGGHIGRQESKADFSELLYC